MSGGNPESGYGGLQDDLAASVIWDDMPGPYKRIVQSVYYSSSCRYIYGFLLLCNLALAIWIIIVIFNSMQIHAAFYVIELGVNLVLLTDVFLRMFLNGCYRYWHIFSNILEFGIVIVCFILTIVCIARN